MCGLGIFPGPRGSIGFVISGRSDLLPSPYTQLGSSLAPIHTIWSALESRAHATPRAIALIGPDGSTIDYRQLFSFALQMQAGLNQAGIGCNDRIAMVLPNGPLMACAFAAVTASAASAPLNPAYRADEFDFYLADLNARALMVMAGVSSPARDVAARRGIAVIELDPRATGDALFPIHIQRSSTARRGGPAQDIDAALILHTSGTTSRPKIVALTQLNLCTSAANIANFLRLRPDDRCLNVMPLFHIHGLIGALLSSLFAGASVFCTEGFSAPGFFAQLRKSRATWYSAVPTMHQALLAEPQGAGGHCLRFIRSCSSALPPRVMANLEGRFGVPVLEAYGMTEASHQIACNPPPPAIRKAGSVGVAAGTEVTILNSTGAAVAATSVGEICIRGQSVTRGYDNNPSANAQAFAGDGWFRTGDQGYIDHDGYIFITGRIKEMINRGGEKISPREIDEILLSHPAVEQAIAFAVPHSLLGEEVAAAVVLRANATVSEEDLRRFVATRLAHFKVPRRILVVAQIPKGPTGKPQRIGLAGRLGIDALTPAAPLRTTFVPARDLLDESLLQLYRDVLNVAEIGIDDNFFLLGGDSLAATRLLVRIREIFGVDVPVARFFSFPTVSGTADFVSTASPHVRELLSEIETMSDEHALSLLERESTL